MARVQHTEWPVGRKPIDQNSIRPGGLWYGEYLDGLLKKAQAVSKPKPKDEVKEFCRIFWVVVIGVAFFAGLYLLIK